MSGTRYSKRRRKGHSRKDVLKAVKENGNALRFHSDFNDDEEVVQAAIYSEVASLKFASPRLRNHAPFLRLAAKRDTAYLSLGSELCDDAEFMRELMMFGLFEDPDRVLMWASERLRNDKGFIMPLLQTPYPLALKMCQKILIHVSTELLSDPEVVLSACSRSRTRQLEYAAPFLKNDRSFVIQAIQKDHHNYQYVSETRKNDVHVVLEFLRSTRHLPDSYQLRVIPKPMYRNRRNVMSFIEANTQVFWMLPSHQRGDKVIALHTFSHAKLLPREQRERRGLLEAVCNGLEDDVDVVMAALAADFTNTTGMGSNFSRDLRCAKAMLSNMTIESKRSFWTSDAPICRNIVFRLAELCDRMPQVSHLQHCVNVFNTAEYAKQQERNTWNKIWCITHMEHEGRAIPEDVQKSIYSFAGMKKQLAIDKELLACVPVITELEAAASPICSWPAVLMQARRSRERLQNGYMDDYSDEEDEEEIFGIGPPQCVIS